MRIGISMPSLLILAFFQVHPGICQYFGGAGKGDGVLAASNLLLDGSFFQGLFAGGNGQGSIVSSPITTTLDGNDVGSLYFGAAGKGEVQNVSYAQSLAGDNLNVLFTGDLGRGEQAALKSASSLGGEALDVVFYGATGRGETTALIAQVAFLDCTLQNMWNGRISTDWELPDNWSCNQVPDANSTVLVPTGVPRYPTVNLSTEIKRIQIDPGASVKVKAGMVLKLNGQ